MTFIEYFERINTYREVRDFRFLKASGAMEEISLLLRSLEISHCSLLFRQIKYIGTLSNSGIGSLIDSKLNLPHYLFQPKPLKDYGCCLLN